MNHMKRFHPIVLSVILASLVVVSGFGLVSTMNLSSPLMPAAHAAGDDEGHSCPMSPLEHISWWSGFSSGVTHQGASLALYSMLIFFGFLFVRRAPRMACIDSRDGILKRQRFRTDIPIPIIALFSDGILQRRVYA